ncbi:MAG: ribose-5-phosphate isomerase RpiA [Gemmataceae bacterium]|nr:ribose-5-phosphate isomerase RpiA [Gemmataceae bacterium]MDW8263864.1 ribose-5-phosphate isomerase RpiA [Gemmataceae bacterium]
MTPEQVVLATKALEFVPDGSRIGLGSGHTAEAFLRVLAERIRQGLRVRGVPTSERIRQLATELGIPVDTLDGGQPLEVTIDGADEVERGTLNLIKGWGAALVRERVVAAASKRQIIIVTAEKLVDRLGSRGRLPVEVVPFAAPFCRWKIERLDVPGGLQPSLRLANDGRPLVTDNGHWILDCRLQPPEDPAALERALRDIPGVVQTGFFLGTASAVLVAENGGVRVMTR